MEGAQIRLGPFLLLEPMGEGGMATVWRGVHEAQGMPVAVKVMAAELTREGAWREAFRREVRAVAGLDHPGVIMVLDQGVADAQAEASSGGRIAAGSPYLVMELASGGSLNRVRGAMPWRLLRKLLLALLDALAHAHARGVIHRDLKTENILLCGPDDLRPGVKLSDFGIAHAMEHLAPGPSDPDGMVQGTPEFMAPEQFMGHWRDYGPWTDLYALGGVAWMLACGALPFVSTAPSPERGLDLARQHIMGPRPPLRAPNPMPEGFEAWLHRMMAIEPRDRFQRAADAAWELAGLSVQAAAADEGRPAITTSPRPAMTLGVDDLEDLLPAQGHSLLYGPPRPSGAPRSPRPPLPWDWRRPRPQAPLQLMGAGLGLYGLRSIEVVGRQAERDALWGALREVRAEGRARLVMLRGGAGVGKSCLARWLTLRADELGSATVLRVTHGTVPGPTDGLGYALAVLLQCVGMDRVGVRERAEAFLAAHGVTDLHAIRELMALVEPALEDEGPQAGLVVRFESPVERYAAMARLLEVLGRVRPVLLWVDDAHWGLDSLALAGYLLKRPSPVRAMVILTAREEALATYRPAWYALTELATHPHAERIDVKPLEAGEHRELVRGLLGLGGSLARRVEARTAGNPLFAVQLVGDWVQRDLLEMSSDGFALRPGVQADLPDDLYQVWRVRVTRFVYGRPLEALHALEVAATLGLDIDQREWEALCRQRGGCDTDDLIDDLMSARLARPHASGWSFRHAMLREALERIAREDGRLGRHHWQCAAMLRALYPEPGPAISERIARHLEGAGQLETAAEHLLATAARYTSLGLRRDAEDLLERHEGVLDQLGALPNDPRRLRAGLRRAEVLIQSGELPEALRVARRVYQQAHAQGLDDLYRESLMPLGRIYLQNGALDLARSFFDSARHHHHQAGEHLAALDAARHLGNVARAAGALDEAEAHFNEALAGFQEAGEERRAMLTLSRLAGLYLRRGELERCEEALQECILRFEPLGARLQTGHARNTLGDLARKRGELAVAEARYLEALADFEAVDSGSALLARLNLGLIQLARGRFGEARAGAEEALVALSQSRRELLAVCARGVALAAAAAQGELEVCRLHLGHIAGYLQTRPLAERDLAWCLDLAVAHLAERDAELAAGACQQAIGLWEVVGDAERLALAHEALKRLTS